MKLFAITENYEGRLVHWFVFWRKQKLVDVPVEALEFFTREEAAAFVIVAREQLQIPHLTVAPMGALPAKSFEDRVIEAGWELSILEVCADLHVGCFEEGVRNPDLRAIEAAFTELERTGVVESSLDDRTGVRRYRATEKGRALDAEQPEPGKDA
jgi:hypothetical protein